MGLLCRERRHSSTAGRCCASLRRVANLEPFEILLECFHAVEQAPVGPQAELLHDNRQRHEVTHVDLRLIGRVLVARVEVHHCARPSAQREELLQAAARRALAAARRAAHELAERHGARPVPPLRSTPPGPRGERAARARAAVTPRARVQPSVRTGEMRGGSDRIGRGLIRVTTVGFDLGGAHERARSAHAPVRARARRTRGTRASRCIRGRGWRRSGARARA